MKKFSAKDDSTGFAVIEAVLILIIIVAVVGIGGYVLNQKQKANKTLSSTKSSLNNTSSLAQPVAPSGTTSSINQLTQRDAQTEAGVDSSADNQSQQDTMSPNDAVSNVGGAYNENSL